MKPQIKLAESQPADGTRLALYEHDGEYSIHVNGQGLMHSRACASEVLMGERGVARIQYGTKALVLIGGLGLGFTLRAVLDGLWKKSKVEVVELFPEIIEWNREYLLELNGLLVDKRQVTMREGDVAEVIRNAEPETYHSILLDVDNGPSALVAEDNANLYSDAGIESVYRALTEQARAIFWSASEDKKFEKRLRKAGFSVTALPAKTHEKARRPAYLLYIADKG